MSSNRDECCPPNTEQKITHLAILECRKQYNCEQLISDIGPLDLHSEKKVTAHDDLVAVED